MEQNNQILESENINVVAILQKIWGGRKIIITLTIVFGLLGIVFALTSTNVYTARTTFIPKGKGGSIGGSGLSGLASLAGINLGGMSGSNSDIPPSMYPMILNSIPFLEKTLASQVTTNGHDITMREYIITEMHFAQKNSFKIIGILKKYTIGLPALLKGKVFEKMNTLPSYVEKSTIKMLSDEDEQLFKYIKNKILINVNDKNGLITLTVDDKDPQVAAILALNIQNLLQQEIINSKIKNSQELLAFTEGLYVEKKAAFEDLQDELATFRDQHQNISSALFQNKLSRLEAEFSIVNAVSVELAKQVEQARIQVRKDTPIFTIIDPVIIPNQRSSPKRTIMVITYTIFGFFLGVGYPLIKNPIINLRKQILEASKTA